MISFYYLYASINQSINQSINSHLKDLPLSTHSASMGYVFARL